ncbi:MBL fold metallo-hydrolase [Ktedonosporobacter rubrisoli]|nr:MBL fold metallo-hydrolase [Ktedonosporobacter rubrisoli]
MSESYTVLLAPNPSVMTGPGTNTIVLGGGSAGAVVIDPADENAEHLAAIIRAGEQRGGIRRILLTHGHPDHVGGAAALRQRLGAPLYAFSRASVPAADEELADGASLALGDDRLRAIYTPGHSADHLCYLLENEQLLFAGDLISGITTNVIADLFKYLNSLRRLQSEQIAEIVPGHGPVIADPQAKIAEYIAHRLQRERQVLQALESLGRTATVPALVEHIYVDVEPRLHPVAAYSVKAHLVKLEREGRVKLRGEDSWQLL